MVDKRIKRRRRQNLWLVPTATAIVFTLILVGIVVLLSPTNKPYLINRTPYFYGYAAYLDSRIEFAVASDWNMGNTIAPGDTIMWVSAPQESIHVGDIVYYKAPDSGKLVAQRVVDKTDTGLLVNGDNSSSEPVEIPFQNLRGLVIGVLYHRSS